VAVVVNEPFFILGLIIFDNRDQTQIPKRYLADMKVLDSGRFLLVHLLEINHGPVMDAHR
jgi:hypothetical protein